MKRDRFTFFESYKNALAWIPEGERLDYLCAIIDYALEGIEPTIQGSARACFELIRPIIDNSTYISETASKNGKKGGAPRGNQNAKKSVSDGAETTEKQAESDPFCGVETTQRQPKTTENNPKTTENKQNKLEGEREGEKEQEQEREANAHTHARARLFCEAYGIAADTEPPPDMDFDKLTKAFSESPDFLQHPEKPYLRRMSWIVKNYDRIVAGECKTFGKVNAISTKGRGKYKIEDDIK